LLDGDGVQARTDPRGHRRLGSGYARRGPWRIIANTTTTSAMLSSARSVWNTNVFGWGERRVVVGVAHA